MSEDFNRFIAECRQRVDSALQNLLPPVSGNGERLREAMRYSLFNGGKRVRPILVYASGRAVSNSLTQAQQDSLDTIACALECIHAYSLVHDDLPAMDDDDLRRGKPTCHIAFDEATAILAGDALQTLALELVDAAPIVDVSYKVARLYQRTSISGNQGMLIGQAIDQAAVNHKLDLAQLESLHRHMSGGQLSASAAMGAIACGAV